MPWQRLVADVALEVDPRTGLLAYREVVVTTPRQSGKTTLELGVMVHRCRTWTRSRVLYSAQSRLHAHKKWEDEHVATLQASPFAGEFTVRYQRGDEAIRWGNGSLHGITAPGEKAGHSEVLDLAVVDEAWAHEDSRLEQGLSPTMVTRPQPQLWVVSTAGTYRSSYLRGKVERGRARTLGRDLGSSVAYFEWSAVEGADPADPATWYGCMPALGRTVTEATIAAEYERLDLADFCRAYLNWEPNAIPADWLVIAEAAWRALADPRSEAVDPVAFAADVTPERSHAAIAVAGRRADGLGHGEVVDDTGPAGSLIAPLEAASVEVVKPSARGMAHAAGDLFDAVAEATMRSAPWTMGGHGPARGSAPICARWSRCPWPARGTPPGRTCTTAGRASTCSTEAVSAGPPEVGEQAQHQRGEQEEEHQEQEQVRVEAGSHGSPLPESTTNRPTLHGPATDLLQRLHGADEPPQHADDDADQGDARGDGC